MMSEREDGQTDVKREGHVRERENERAEGGVKDGTRPPACDPNATVSV